jgi:hypothetical protein
MLEYGVEFYPQTGPLQEGTKLFAVSYKRYRAPVRILDEEHFHRLSEEIKDYSRVVELEVDEGDWDWIGKFHLRPRDEKLKDMGRPLMRLEDAEPLTEETSSESGRAVKRTNRIPWLKRMGLDRPSE